MMWKSIGTSVIGSSHSKTDKPCQDSHGIRLLTEEVLLLAVADGLGSAERSEIGSHLAVEAALSSLETSLSDVILSAEICQSALENAFSSARKALEIRTEEENIELRDLGTTLICSIVSPGLVCCAQIGDGAVVGQQIDDHFALLSSPQRGEYANETIPLTTKHALDMVRYSIQATDIKALAIISDGLQNLALQGTEYVPFAQFFTPFFNLLSGSTDLEQTQKKIEAFLSSDRVLGRTDDDKTLLIVVREQLEEVDTLKIHING